MIITFVILLMADTVVPQVNAKKTLKNAKGGYVPLRVLYALEVLPVLVRPGMRPPMYVMVLNGLNFRIQLKIQPTGILTTDAPDRD